MKEKIRKDLSIIPRQGFLNWLNVSGFFSSIGSFHKPTWAKFNSSLVDTRKLHL